MTAQDRAREIAKAAGLGPEDTGSLVARAAKLGALDPDGLEQAAREHHAAAQRAPRSPLVGAQALLIRILREDAVVAGLPDDAAREDYAAKLHGFGPVAGTSGGLAGWAPEPPPRAAVEPDPGQKAAADAGAARAAAVAELRKSPALRDPAHKDHLSAVAQLAKLHEE